MVEVQTTKSLMISSFADLALKNASAGMQWRFGSTGVGGMWSKPKTLGVERWVRNAWFRMW